MDLLIGVILEQPAIWNYVFPINVIAVAFLLFGVGLQLFFLRKKRKWFLLPLIWLLLALGSEGIYYADGTFEAFGVAIFGVMAYLALFGALFGTLFHMIRTKVRHF